MYERTGRYYALFGPKAVTTDAEERFLRHWARGRERALDLGAGLCGPATMLARLGLDVLAFEPSPILGALALDRLGRVSEEGGKVTLVEGDTATFAEPFKADLLLMRSVWMLLDDAQRKLAIEALRRHCAPGARLIADSADDLSRDLSAAGFAIEQLYAAYDLDLAYAASSEMIVAIASG